MRTEYKLNYALSYVKKNNNNPTGNQKGGKTEGVKKIYIAQI